MRLLSVFVSNLKYGYRGKLDVINTLRASIGLQLAGQKRHFNGNQGDAMNSLDVVEYYEEAPSSSSHSETPTLVSPQKRELRLKDLMSVLEQQRVLNIFVVQLGPDSNSPYNHILLCSIHNARQASSVAENLRRLMKVAGEANRDHSRATTKRSNGWYVTNIDDVQVHVMSEECRKKYDLEAMWSGDESLKDDDDLGYPLYPVQKFK